MHCQSASATPAPPVVHTHPARQCDGHRQFDTTLPSLTPRLNPHRARGTDGAHSPAISCLGAFPTPVSEPVAGLVIAGVRKPAQNRTVAGYLSVGTSEVASSEPAARLAPNADKLQPRYRAGTRHLYAMPTHIFVISEAIATRVTVMWAPVLAKSEQTCRRSRRLYAKATRMSVASLLTLAVPHVAVGDGELHPHPEAGSSPRRPARFGPGKRI